MDLSELTAKPDFADKLFGQLNSLEHGNDPLWLISASISDAELKRVGITKVEKSMVRLFMPL